MIQVEHITRQFGGRTVLRDVTFGIEDGARAGIIGPNGSGKSTLLRIIAGEETADTGRIELSPGSGDEPPVEVFPSLRIATAGDTVLAEAAERLAAATEAELLDAERRYADVLAALSSVRPLAEIEATARAIAADLTWLHAAPGVLSSGELAKLALIDLVAGRPDALLLDEPTNHLDMAGIEWLEDYLDAFAGPVAIVSHDRAFLDALTDSTVALDIRSGAAETWHGDYSSWMDEQTQRVAEQWQEYERQQREERHLNRVISAIESRSRNIEQRTIHFHYRKRAKKVARRATTLKARMQRQQTAEEHVSRPARATTGLHGEFTGATSGASRLVEVIDATVAVPGRTLVEHVDLAVDRGQRVFITGPNGSGKSTLLRVILGELPAEAGRVHLAGSALPGVLRQTTADVIWPGPTPVDVIRHAAGVAEAEAFNLLHRFLVGHDLARQPLERLSEGERQRLQLAMLIVGGSNLLVLDEPTNHLDLLSREAFEAALGGFDGAVLAVSHDRYFVDQFADEVFEIVDGRLVGRAITV